MKKANKSHNSKDDSRIDALAILNNLTFRQLVNIRNRIRTVLTALAFSCHAFFVGGIAFYNQWFAEPISVGSSIPKGIVITIIVILSLVIFEFIYLYLNKIYVEPLLEKIKIEVLENA